MRRQFCLQQVKRGPVALNEDRLRIPSCILSFARKARFNKLTIAGSSASVASAKRIFTILEFAAAQQ